MTHAICEVNPTPSRVRRIQKSPAKPFDSPAKISTPQTHVERIRKELALEIYPVKLLLEAISERVWAELARPD